jgi:cell division protein FtsI/penicillin-binding protein 2
VNRTSFAPTNEDQFFRRVFALGLIVVCLAAVSFGRLVYVLLRPLPWEPLPGPAQTETFVPERGSIFDRNGYVLSAARTLADIEASPSMVTETETVAELLAPVLEEPSEVLIGKLASSSTYVSLRKGARWSVADTVGGWELQGVTVRPYATRIYPHGALAATVLGFVNAEGNAYYGVESKWDPVLRGSPGARTPHKDPLGSLFYQVNAPRHGADLYLTVDRRAQARVEQILANAVQKNEAEKGTAIVVDPGSGAILAMAVYPTYDPNFREVDDYSTFVNWAVSEHYEPGSVFKIVTIASGLDAGIITPHSTYYDGGEIVVGGEVMRNSDNGAHGETTVRDLLARSLNVGAAEVSTKLGAYGFYEYVRRFGFNELTEVDLAGEVPGNVRFPGDREWHESDLGTNSFGQGLAVTPLQMLSAVAAVANDGVMMWPHVVDRVVYGHSVTNIEPKVVRRVISREAAQQVTDMLVYAVDTVLPMAAVDGYRVAGKSGTSEVPTITGYDPEETVASFAGYVPADDPRFAILVVLDRPQRQRWGSQTAGPAFGQIAEQLLGLYTVPSDSGHTARAR